MEEQSGRAEQEIREGEQSGREELEVCRKSIIQYQMYRANLGNQVLIYQMQKTICNEPVKKKLLYKTYDTE